MATSAEDANVEENVAQAGGGGAKKVPNYPGPNENEKYPLVVLYCGGL